MDNATPIPTDEFSRRRRQLADNQGALHATSTITTRDFYGNEVTWVLDSYDDGDPVTFVQWNDAQGGSRLMLPTAVVRALARHRDAIAAKAKRRQGHTLVALRKTRGDKLGNPEALAKARRRKT